MPTYLGQGKRIEDPRGAVPGMYHSTSLDRLFDIVPERSAVNENVSSDLDAYFAKLDYDKIPRELVNMVAEEIGISLARKMLPFRFLLDNP